MRPLVKWDSSIENIQIKAHRRKKNEKRGKEHKEYVIHGEKIWNLYYILKGEERENGAEAMK